MCVGEAFTEIASRCRQWYRNGNFQVRMLPFRFKLKLEYSHFEKISVNEGEETIKSKALHAKNNLTLPCILLLSTSPRNQLAS